MPSAPKVLRLRRTARPPERRPNAYQRGYNDRWRRRTAQWIQEQAQQGNVMCAECGKPLTCGRDEIHVDHKEPHRGDQDKFWDESGWQMLHARCHSRKTKRGE